MAWKSFLVLFFSLFLFLHIGCSSSEEGEAEQSDVEMSEEGDFDEDGEDFAEEDGEEGEEDLFADEDSDLDGGDDDLFGEEDSEEGGESDLFAEEESAGEEAEEDLFADEVSDEAGDLFAAGTEEENAMEADQSADAGLDLGDNFEEGPADVALPDDTAVAPAAAEPVQQTTGLGYIPVKKIKTQTYLRAGMLVNSVYLGRPGDTVSSISQKIYGQDRSQELLAVNPHLNRGVDPGDKLYYNSPNRPSDDTQILTYAQDVGITPSYYQTQRGDNIREVSKSLMGYEGAWKEVWAVNPELTSDEKWSVQAGRNLKYWPSIEAVPAPNSMGGLASAPQPGMNELAAAPEPEPEPVSEPALDELQEELPPEFAEVEDPFAEAPGDQAISDEIDMNPPPDFDVGDDPFAESEELSSVSEFDAPPPPPAESQRPAVARQAKSGGQNDLMMMVGAAALILIGVGGLVVARRKRQAAAVGGEQFDLEEMEKTEVG